jgi:hypothetical protein
MAVPAWGVSYDTIVTWLNGTIGVCREIMGKLNTTTMHMPEMPDTLDKPGMRGVRGMRGVGGCQV